MTEVYKKTVRENEHVILQGHGDNQVCSHEMAETKTKKTKKLTFHLFCLEILFNSETDANLISKFDRIWQKSYVF